MRPHRRQPTRLPRPWYSPGKNTGVGCHFLLQWMKVKSESEITQSCSTPSDPMDCSPPGSSVHGIFQARVLELVAIAFSGPIIGKDIKRKHAQLPCLKQRWAREKGETETMNRVSSKLIFVNYCQCVLHRPTALASPSPALPYTRWVRHWGGGVWTKSVCVCVCVCVCVGVCVCVHSALSNSLWPHGL